MNGFIKICLLEVPRSLPELKFPKLITLYNRQYTSYRRGDRHYLCLDSAPDIAQREDSGCPRSVAPWSHCESDILCEPVMILSASLCVRYIFPKLVSLACVLQTGAA